MKRLYLPCTAGALALIGSLLSQPALQPAIAAEDNPLKSFLKTAPKAPDAWCQREAMNAIASVAGAPRDGGAGGASPQATVSDGCNPAYVQRLSACALDGHTGTDNADQTLAVRMRTCMSDMAGEGVKPAL